LRRHSAGSKPRGIGILADEDTNPIGWKPMPLLPAHQEKSKTCKQRAVGMMPIPRSFWTIGKVDRAVPARYFSLLTAIEPERSGDGPQANIAIHLMIKVSSLPRSI
jgi:hypothetical protein